MGKLFVFSGACNSGKTTTMKAIYEWLIKKGGYSIHDVVILNELIRDTLKCSIDEIRKNPNAYVELQDTIIRKKIEAEKSAYFDSRDTIYLVDRALSDSLFYLETYVNTVELDDLHVSMYKNLYSYLLEAIKVHFTFYYSYVFEFEPFDNIQLDAFRPQNIDRLQILEDTCIHRINIFYANVRDTYKRISVKNKDTKTFILDKILK